ncbi:DICT sensory domain-containing protein [Haloferacaceae archaeon DSL9]
MSLIELISTVEAHQKTLTVVNTDSKVVEQLREQFADRNVEVVEGGLDGNDSSFAMLSADGEFVTAIGIDRVLADDRTVQPGFEPKRYRPILDELDETMFTSFSNGKMVAASREIEDRAWRMGNGTLHAGFQTLSNVEKTNDVYEHLGTREDLTVLAYAAPEGEVPDHSNYLINIERAPEIRATWFVVYDGGGVDANKCALLAEERETGRFYGFWSYDPATVDYLTDHLTTTYGVIETDGSGSDETEERDRRRTA